jgi:hypothetical protein
MSSSAYMHQAICIFLPFCEMKQVQAAANSNKTERAVEYFKLNSVK